MISNLTAIAQVTLGISHSSNSNSFHNLVRTSRDKPNSLGKLRHLICNFHHNLCTMRMCTREKNQTRQLRNIQTMHVSYNWTQHPNAKLSSLISKSLSEQSFEVTTDHFTPHAVTLLVVSWSRKTGFRHVCMQEWAWVYVCTSIKECVNSKK